MGESQEPKESAAQVSPTEDLMREHGILLRILLIYKNIIFRLQSNFLDGDSLVYSRAFEATDIIKRFIEEYHQTLEEDYVFPVISSVNQHTRLVQDLLDQHQAAKRNTNELLRVLRLNQRTVNRQRLICLMSEFIKMYEPHTAREDTVIFPAFHQLTLPDVYNRLGGQFEDIEEKKFGEGGFEKIERKVTEIESSLGIHDLGKYTIRN